MPVPAPGRALAHPLAHRATPRASRVSSPRPACLGLQPLGAFLHPLPASSSRAQRARPPASASPGYVCPSEASSLRYWIRWDSDGFQKPSVCAPAGRKRTFPVPLGSRPRRLHRHRGQASATAHQGLHYGSGMKTYRGAPRLRSWRLCLAQTAHWH